MNINKGQTALDHLALAEKRNHLAMRLIAALLFSSPITTPHLSLNTPNSAR